MLEVRDLLLELRFFKPFQKEAETKILLIGRNFSNIRGGRDRTSGSQSSFVERNLFRCLLPQVTESIPFLAFLRQTE